MSRFVVSRFVMIHFVMIHDATRGARDGEAICVETIDVA